MQPTGTASGGHDEECATAMTGTESASATLANNAAEQGGPQGMTTMPTRGRGRGGG